MFRLIGSPNKGEVPRVYPTTLRMPIWARPLAITQAISTLRISEIEVKQISDIFEKEAGLLRPLALPDLPPAFDPREYFEEVQTAAPVDGTEVVDWMQVSAVENAVLSARMAEYNRLGSQMVARSGDGYVPGVYADDCFIYRIQTGADVASAGYGIARTPRGNFQFPHLGGSTGIFRDLISWASESRPGGIQWNASLIKWKSLAETPIGETVGFYRDWMGNSAPNFFVQKPTRPKLSVTVRQRFSSSDPQTLGIIFREPSNYSQNVGTKSVAIAAGTHDVSYTVSAFPFVPPLVAEIQGANGVDLKLDAYEVS